MKNRNLRSIVNRLFLLLVMGGFAMNLVGCAKPFIPRDVYYDNSADTDTEETQVVLVALSQDEWGSVEKTAKKKDTERSKQFEAKIGSAWSGRAKLVTLSGASEMHTVLSKDDPMWKSFLKAKDPKGNPVVWCALIVVGRNWIPGGGDGWASAYRGAPEDEIPAEQPAVTFKWIAKSSGVGGMPVCLSSQRPSGQ
jgi:hypothetical protein